MEITAKEQNLLEALLESETETAACQKAGVSRTFLYRRKTGQVKSSFMTVYEECLEGILSGVIHDLKRESIMAKDTVVKAARGESIKPLQLRAAQDILDRCGLKAPDINMVEISKKDELRDFYMQLCNSNDLDVDKGQLNREAV